MKQIIIRVKDYNGKLIAKDYFYSQARFFDEAAEFIYNNMEPGDEVQIKIGNLHVVYFTHSELMDAMQDYKIYDELDLNHKQAIQLKYIEDYSVKYYVKEYLPQY